jgi:predicted short-subunit dehydrogenase-like oxidoreductase (DUF2520 family)
VSTIKRIAVIGSGKAGTYFAENLIRQDLQVKGYARRYKQGFQNLEEIKDHLSEYDLVLLCVADEAIAEVSSSLPVVPCILAHVSGVTDISAIDQKHPNPAVFYPPMSLTPETPPSIEAIPFCIEALKSETEYDLMKLAESLGASAHRIDSEERAFLHLGAVLSQNFSNYLYTRTQEILKARNIDFRLLLPLLEQSLERLKFIDPGEVQTGPAVRGDRATMEKHLEMIDDKDLKEVYRLISKNIGREHDQEL